MRDTSMSSLLTGTLKALDEYSKSIGDGYKYLLTVASPAGMSLETLNAYVQGISNKSALQVPRTTIS